MAFNNLQTADELIRFLENQARNDHPFLYHFTTAEKLKCICENRTWRLNSAQRMNDLHECTLKTNFSPLWNTIYSTCFSFGDPDNFAMWAMYGIPWEDAIRIRFSIEDMKKWIDDLSNNKQTNQQDEGCLFPPDHLKLNNSDRIFLHDICYYKGFFGSNKVLTDCPRNLATQQQQQECFTCGLCPEKKLLWWDQKNNHTEIVENGHNPPYLDEKFIGYVKNSAWAHENETRLTLIKADTTSDYIDVPISDNILKKIQISIGPKSTLKTEQIQRMMAKYLLGSEDKFGQITNVSYSYYNDNYTAPARGTSLLKIRRHCDKYLPHSVRFKNSLE